MRFAPRRLRARRTIWQGRTHAPSRPGKRRLTPQRPDRVGDIFGYATPNLWRNVSGFHCERTYRGSDLITHVEGSFPCRR